MIRPRTLLAITMFVLITASVACGSSTSNADKTATAGAGRSANPTAPATATGNANPTAPVSTTPSSGAAGKKQLSITAQDFSFGAASIDVSKGDVIDVTFTNDGPSTHTLSFFSDDAYKNPIAGADTGNVSADATSKLTVTADVGLYYRCNIHPAQMQGEIEFAK